MKLVLDTDTLKLPKLNFLQNCSDREVFYICLITILTGYTLSDYFDSKQFYSLTSRLESVEVTLDKVIDNINSRTIQESKNEKVTYQLRNYNIPLKLSDKEFNCLTKNVYWEAMHEPYIGQIAVAQVTYNRLLSEKWGKDFCSVVYAKKQFSWTNNESIRLAQPKNLKQWNRARHTVKLFSRGVRITNLQNTQFYFANYIKPPKWSLKMNHETTLGKHLFYSQPNKIPDLASLAYLP